MRSIKKEKVAETRRYKAASRDYSEKSIRSRKLTSISEIRRLQDKARGLEEENQIIVAEIEKRLEEVTIMTLEEFYERLQD